MRLIDRIPPRLVRALRAISRVARRVLIVGVVVFAGWFAWTNFPDAYNPFLPPDLRATPNFLTSFKLRGLDGDHGLCMAVIDASGAKARADSISSPSAGCGMAEGLYLQQSQISWGGGIRMTCPTAAALLMWERHVVAPAAAEHLGSDVVRIRHYGSYACRNVNNAAAGRISGHAAAKAIDVAGFDLADGRRISVAGDWGEDTGKGRFLAEVHQGACGLFSMVLGPDYNARHADHFHFEMASWGMCR
jgi:hypothetical protein